MVRVLNSLNLEDFDKPQILEAAYPFIRDDCFLIARVNKSTGKQELIIRKINPKTKRTEFESKIKCIHTVVCTLGADEFQDNLMDEHFDEFVLNIRSSEKIKEINLSPDEKFKAFKSWVAGIAESGMNAFKIQSDIEKASDILYPIAEPLLKFMIRIDKEYVFEYLNMIEHYAEFEGVRYEAYLIANLNLVLETILDSFIENSEKVSDILSQIAEMKPPIEIFSIKKFNIYLLSKEIRKLDDFDTLRHCHDYDMLGFYLSNKISFFEEEIERAKYVDVEEAKRIAGYYRMKYVYEQDLKGIKEIRTNDVRRSIHRINILAEENRRIKRRLPVKLELIDYKPDSGRLTMHATPIRRFIETKDFLSKIIVKICRQLMPNFSFGKIEIRW